MNRDNCTLLEASYARSFYTQIDKPELVAKVLGGRYPCSRTGNKVFIDCLGIESMISFHEFDGRCIKLRLQMEITKEGEKETENFEDFPCLDIFGSERVDKKLFEKIIRTFYLPNLKYFYDLYNPK